MLNGAHAVIANDCAMCHNGNYNNTPNTCVGCHQSDYNGTTDPNHVSAQFPTDCATCHSETAWTPSTFNHDGLYFPIYSGSHNGQWDQCMDCHTNASNYSQFTCITCHTNPETNNNHNGVGGYYYSSPACLACHPNGEADGSSFDHNTTNFPLTGAHLGVDCIECHANGYQGTSTACVDCHTTDYNASTNPNHQALGIPTDCASCHTTAPGWAPATFNIHANYYALTGAHLPIANQCVTCHNGNYNNTPDDCVGCHNSDYTSSLNPNHVALNLPMDCAVCHTTNPNWDPATFPIHNNFYPLIGAHAAIANDCAMCHNGNYNNTPSTCYGCHATDYNNANNPDHNGANFPTDCTTCHNQSSWTPADWDHDGMYFPIYSGKHNGEWDQCMDCHTNSNNYAVFSCLGCHTNPGTNNDHNGIQGYQYNSNACLMCHPDGEVMDHDDMYFPIFSGEHEGEWDQCSDCHTNPSNYAIFSCFQCHSQNSTNNDHQGVSGYSYNSNACYNCHPDGSE